MSERARTRPVGTTRRIILLVVGTLALGLGALGIVLPILPTTPFLLVAAACYVRSSDRLHSWLKANAWFGPRLESYLSQRGLPIRVKVVSLIVAWASIGSFAVFAVESLWIRALLLLVLLAKTVFMARVKTAR